MTRKRQQEKGNKQQATGRQAKNSTQITQIKRIFADNKICGHLLKSALSGRLLNKKK
jgi:hypothetical protein